MKKKQLAKIVIVIPSYNEAENIRATISQIVIHIKANHDFSFKIIVVDDNSSDASIDILNDIRKSILVDFIILKNDINEGIAYATKKLLKAATEYNPDFILKCDMDADFPHDKVLSLLLNEIQNNAINKLQVIIGERQVTVESTMSNLEISEQQKMIQYLSDNFNIKNYNPVSSGVVLYSNAAIRTLLNLNVVESYELRWGLDFLLPLVATKLKFNVTTLKIDQGKYTETRRSEAKIKEQYSAYYQVLNLVAAESF